MNIGTTPSSKIIEVAQTLARRVGVRIKEVATSDEVLEVSHKGISDIVTEIDLWSEKEIVSTVRREFPDHIVVGEETSAALSDTLKKSLPEIVSQNICWIVDPLDGTSNFSNKIPHCAVSIGIVEKGIRVAGVVYDPFRDEMFHAVKNEGAFLNNVRIRSSAKTELIKCLVAIGFPNDRWLRWDEYQPITNAIIMSARNVRACGAAAIEVCWVACGRFDAFFEYSIKAWDIAAASLIVDEAGGRSKSYGNIDGKDFSLFARSFLFAADGVFTDMDQVIVTQKPKSPAPG